MIGENNNTEVSTKICTIASIEAMANVQAVQPYEISVSRRQDNIQKAPESFEMMPIGRGSRIRKVPGRLTDEPLKGGGYVNIDAIDSLSKANIGSYYSIKGKQIAKKSASAPAKAKIKGKNGFGSNHQKQAIQTVDHLQAFHSQNRAVDLDNVDLDMGMDMDMNIDALDSLLKVSEKMNEKRSRGSKMSLPENTKPSHVLRKASKRRAELEHMTRIESDDEDLESEELQKPVPKASFKGFRNHPRAFDGLWKQTALNERVGGIQGEADESDNSTAVGDIDAIGLTKLAPVATNDNIATIVIPNPSEQAVVSGTNGSLREFQNDLGAMGSSSVKLQGLSATAELRVRADPNLHSAASTLVASSDPSPIINAAISASQHVGLPGGYDLDLRGASSSAGGASGLLSAIELVSSLGSKSGSAKAAGQTRVLSFPLQGAIVCIKSGKYAGYQGRVMCLNKRESSHGYHVQIIGTKIKTTIVEKGFDVIQDASQGTAGLRGFKADMTDKGTYVKILAGDYAGCLAVILSRNITRDLIRIRVAPFQVESEDKTFTNTYHRIRLKASKFRPATAKEVATYEEQSKRREEEYSAAKAAQEELLIQKALLGEVVPGVVVIEASAPSRSKTGTAKRSDLDTVDASTASSLVPTTANATVPVTKEAVEAPVTDTPSLEPPSSAPPLESSKGVIRKAKICKHPSNTAAIEMERLATVSILLGIGPEATAQGNQISKIILANSARCAEEKNLEKQGKLPTRQVGPWSATYPVKQSSAGEAGDAAPDGEPVKSKTSGRGRGRPSKAAIALEKSTDIKKVPTTGGGFAEVAPDGALIRIIPETLEELATSDQATDQPRKRKPSEETIEASISKKLKRSTDVALSLRCVVFLDSISSFHHITDHLIASSRLLTGQIPSILRILPLTRF